jgi:hypothetical protein
MVKFIYSYGQSNRGLFSKMYNNIHTKNYMYGVGKNII